MMQVVGGMDRLPAALADAAREPHCVSRSRARDTAERTRRVGHICRCGREGQTRRCRLLCLHYSITGAERASEGLLTAGPVGHCCGHLRWRRQDRVAVQAALLGRRRRDPRRQVMDRPGDRTDHLSLARLPGAQRDTRGLLHGFQEDHARARACRTFSAWRSSKAPAYTRSTATEFETAFSVSWPRVPWSRGSWRSETALAHQALAALQHPTAGCISPAIT